MNMLDLMY